MFKAMPCNILVSRPLKCHLTMRAGGYYLFFIVYYIIPSLLIIERLGAWPIAQSMIITLDAVPKNACGRVTGNYYITSHGLMYPIQSCCVTLLNASFISSSGSVVTRNRLSFALSMYFTLENTSSSGMRSGL